MLNLWSFRRRPAWLSLVPMRLSGALLMATAAATSLVHSVSLHRLTLDGFDWINHDRDGRKQSRCCATFQFVHKRTKYIRLFNSRQVEEVARPGCPLFLLGTTTIGDRRNGKSKREEGLRPLWLLGGALSLWFLFIVSLFVARPECTRPAFVNHVVDSTLDRLSDVLWLFFFFFPSLSLDAIPFVIFLSIIATKWNVAQRRVLENFVWNLSEGSAAARPRQGEMDV